MFNSRVSGIISYIRNWHVSQPVSRRNLSVPSVNFEITLCIRNLMFNKVSSVEQQRNTRILTNHTIFLIILIL